MATTTSTGAPSPIKMVRPQDRDLARRTSSKRAVSVVSVAAGADYDSDIVYSDLTFTNAKATSVAWLGFPQCGLNLWRCCRQTSAFCHLVANMEKHSVVILDARKRQLGYEQTGFTLRPFKSKVSDWSKAIKAGEAEHEVLKSEFEEQIRALHPEVKKITFNGFLLRGGNGANPPAANGLHLDLFPDLERVNAFSAAKGGDNTTTDDPELAGLQLRMILGLWMPRDMSNPVHDYPFFMGDASTFKPEDIVPQKQDFYQIGADGKPQRVLNIAANPPKFSARQRWYYYPQQTCEELTVFRHLTNPAGGKACFHAAFKQPLPEGMETRKSVETRAMLFW